MMDSISGFMAAFRQAAASLGRIADGLEHQNGHKHPYLSGAPHGCARDIVGKCQSALGRLVYDLLAGKVRHNHQGDACFVAMDGLYLPDCAGSRVILDETCRHMLMALSHNGYRGRRGIPTTATYHDDALFICAGDGRAFRSGALLVSNAMLDWLGIPPALLLALIPTATPKPTDTSPTRLGYNVLTGEALPADPAVPEATHTDTDTGLPPFDGLFDGLLLDGLPRPAVQPAATAPQHLPQPPTEAEAFGPPPWDNDADWLPQQPVPCRAPAVQPAATATGPLRAPEPAPAAPHPAVADSNPTTATAHGPTAPTASPAGQDAEAAKPSADAVAEPVAAEMPAAHEATPDNWVSGFTPWLRQQILDGQCPPDVISVKDGLLVGNRAFTAYCREQGRPANLWVRAIAAFRPAMGYPPAFTYRPPAGQVAQVADGCSLTIHGQLIATPEKLLDLPASAMPPLSGYVTDAEYAVQARALAARVDAELAARGVKGVKADGASHADLARWLKDEKGIAISRKAVGHFIKRQEEAMKPARQQQASTKPPKNRVKKPKLATGENR